MLLPLRVGQLGRRCLHDRVYKGASSFNQSLCALASEGRGGEDGVAGLVEEDAVEVGEVRSKHVEGGGEGEGIVFVSFFVGFGTRGEQRRCRRSLMRTCLNCYGFRLVWLGVEDADMQNVEMQLSRKSDHLRYVTT